MKTITTIFALILIVFLMLAPRAKNYVVADCWDYSANAPCASQQAASSFAGSGAISQAIPLTQNTFGTNCLFTSQVQWSTQNVQTASVTVLNPDTGEEKLFAQGLQGTAQAPWIQPQKNYRFTLWDESNGQKRGLSTMWVSGSNLACASMATQPPYSQPASYPTPIPSNKTQNPGSNPCYYNVPGCTSWVEVLPQYNNSVSNFQPAENQTAAVPISRGNPGSNPCYYNVPGCTSYVEQLPPTNQSFSSTPANQNRYYQNYQPVSNYAPVTQRCGCNY